MTESNINNSFNYNNKLIKSFKKIFPSDKTPHSSVRAILNQLFSFIPFIQLQNKDLSIKIKNDISNTFPNESKEYFNKATRTANGDFEQILNFYTMGKILLYNK
jgi:hypothetical protein